MDLRAATDEALMEALPDELEAMETLYDRHAAPALGLAVRMLGDRQLAEDVVQDAFLALWRNACRYQADRGSVRTWLMGIVHHRAIDRLRGRAPLTPLPDEPPWDAGSEDPCTTAVRRLDGQAVRQALAALPLEQRQTIELAYFAGLTHVQIAAAQALPLGTVKGRLRLALARLRRELRDYVDYDAATLQGFPRSLAISPN